MKEFKFTIQRPPQRESHTQFEKDIFIEKDDIQLAREMQQHKKLSQLHCDKKKETVDKLLSPVVKTIDIREISNEKVKSPRSKKTDKKNPS